MMGLIMKSIGDYKKMKEDKLVLNLEKFEIKNFINNFHFLTEPLL